MAQEKIGNQRQLCLFRFQEIPGDELSGLFVRRHKQEWIPRSSCLFIALCNMCITKVNLDILVFCRNVFQFFFEFFFLDLYPHIWAGLFRNFCREHIPEPGFSVKNAAESFLFFPLDRKFFRFQRPDAHEQIPDCLCHQKHLVLIR